MTGQHPQPWRTAVATALGRGSAGDREFVWADRVLDALEREGALLTARHRELLRPSAWDEAGNRFPSSVEPQTSPGGTPGAREHTNDRPVPSMAMLAARLREIHWPVGAPDEGPMWCSCCKPWPCPTELALRAVESATSPTGDPTP